MEYEISLSWLGRLNTMLSPRQRLSGPGKCHKSYREAEEHTRSLQRRHQHGHRIVQSGEGWTKYRSQILHHIYRSFTGKLRAVLHKIVQKHISFLCHQMLSLLPSRVLRLMEFLGFSGDRVSGNHAVHVSLERWCCLLSTLVIFQELGLSELRQGAASNSLRSILSTLTLLMFHLYITVILGEAPAVKSIQISSRTKLRSMCLIPFFPQVLVKQT